MSMQQVLFTGRKYKAHSDFWRTQLARLNGGFCFRGRRVNGANGNGAAQSHELGLDEATSSLICSTGNEQDLGVFVVLLTSFIYLLSKYTDHQIITLKSPLLAGGDAANTYAEEVILAETIDYSRTLKEMLGGVKQTVAQSYKFQNFPLQSVLSLEELQSKGNTNVFICYPQIHRAYEVSGSYDLVLEIARQDRAITLKFLYQGSSFDESFVQAFARHYENVLASFKSPTARLCEVNILSDAERERILFDFNDTAIGYPQDKTLPELFAEQVEKNPSSVAVKYGEQHLSYQELNERANQLAAHLQTIGVGCESRVGLCVERSLEMVVGLLGILKAGAAYVPLDPSYPEPRLSFMLDDAAVEVLLTQGALLPWLPAYACKVVCLDDWAEIAKQSSANPPRANVSADNLAYITYTSGSTGVPKGVCITHRAITRLVYGMPQVKLDAQEVILQAAPLAFDASTFELWGALLHGGCVALLAADLPTAGALREVLANAGVTTMWLTSALYNAVLDEDEEALVGVRQLLVGGEALSVEHVRRGLARLGVERLINGYGPTEATTFACSYEVKEVTAGETSIAIGKPLGNTQAYVLDERQAVVPVGVSGELYIGGAGLARGYWNRAELTAERFLPHPYSAEPGARLYRTGDVVRYRPDGNLEFLGRQDQQVKVRGHRIELGEVEAALQQHADVAECVVTVSDERLVGYVVGQAGQELKPAELRAYLEARLPEYMVPSQFQQLAALPVTANGKVDRKALPELEATRAQLEAEFVAPTTAEEEILAGIFEHVLKVEQVGVYDNFFDLGGDSLRAIQVVSRARARGLTLSTPQLFQYPTIFQLAQQAKVGECETETPPSEPFNLIAAEDRAKLPADVTDAYPLTRLQAGMLFHTEYSPESGLYNDIFSLQLKSVFDESSLRTALDRVAARHAVLRTSFDFVGFEEPLQLVHQQVSIPLVVEDITALSAAEQDQKTAALIDTERKRNFDWNQAPLMRAHVYQRASNRFQLTLSFHHAILDGWSMSSLLTELFPLYSGLLKGEAAPAEPPLASSFRDFVALERTAMASAPAQEYWSAKLEGNTSTQLPRWPSSYRQADAPQAGSLCLDIPQELCGDLRKLAHLAEVPIKSVLLAAHLRVMSLVSGQSDVLTGVVSHGRTETTNGEHVLGLFLNTVPFRQKLKGGTWKDLVQEVFDIERDMMPFHRYPMAQMKRDGGGLALFETAFNFVHFHVYQGLKGLDSVKLLKSGGFEQTNFPFIANFSVDPSSESQIRIGLSYYPTEFCEAQIQAIGEYYLRTLEAMATQPSTSYDSVSLLSPAEEDTLKSQWNATRHAYQTGRCIHDVIAAQAARTPDAVAVVFEDKQLSYGELNTRANQLAHRLQELGVGPDLTVGICMQRCAQMVVAQLATLKAGAAYVPLDPDYPAQRLAFMLTDAQVAVLLTQASLLERLPVDGAPILCLDRDAAEIATASTANPVTAATPGNLAYVIYTSGSTGLPKGVAVAHDSLLNLISWHQQTYELNEASRGTQLASCGFDAAAWEVWPYLCAGAAVYIVADETRLWPEQLSDWLVANEITVTFVPTPLAQSLLALPWPAESKLKQMLVGGDKLSQRPQAEANFALINHYGPTENTVVATAGNVEPEAEGRGVPTIGKAIGNVQVYVLDQRLLAAPVGTGGELCIGGASLARGYWNRAELTAERFIPNPFSAEPGARLYRTGDLVRYLPNGELEFLGRVDDQVKVRGYRIELGEIESALNQHPSVSESVVIVRAARENTERTEKSSEESKNESKNESRNEKLVAYVVGVPEQTVTATELAAYLQEKLPEYMVPAAFVTLDAIPLTANGKVDRKALPAPGSHADEQRAYVPPTTPAEEILVGIFKQVLKVKEVGITDNFFQLGGDSILSIQVVSRAAQQGLHLTPKLLFKHPTIVDLAARATTARLTAAEQGEVTGAVTLTPIQRWFFANDWPGFDHFNQSMMLEVAQPMEPERLRAVVDVLLRHHDALRMRYEQNEHGEWLQRCTGIDELVETPFSYRDFSTLSAKDARSEIERETNAAQQSLSLERGPMMRVIYFDLGAERGGRLLLIVHHLVMDGVSWRILLEDLQSAYEQLTRGLAVALPPKTTSFQSWASRLKQYADSAQLANEAGYWATVEQRLLEQESLPVVKKTSQGRREMVARALTEEQTTSLLTEVGAAYHTQIQEVLLTALVEALWTWTGKRDVVVQMEGHGREEFLEQVDVTRTLGWFTTLYPLHLDLRRTHGVGPALKAIKEQVRAVPAKGIGYGVWKYLKNGAPAVGKGKVSEAEISFNYLGQFDQVLGQDGQLSAAKESSGSAQSEASQRQQSVEISLSVVAGRLQLGWSYYSERHERATMERVAEQYIKELEKIIEHCKAEEAGGWTPSDFPLAQIDKKNLNKLLTKLNKSGVARASRP